MTRGGRGVIKLEKWPDIVCGCLQGRYLFSPRTKENSISQNGIGVPIVKGFVAYCLKPSAISERNSFGILELLKNYNSVGFSDRLKRPFNFLVEKADAIRILQDFDQNSGKVLRWL